MPQYRIVSNGTVFRVQRRFSILGFGWWFYWCLGGMKDPDGWGTFLAVPKDFTSREDTEAFLRDVDKPIRGFKPV